MEEEAVFSKLYGKTTIYSIRQQIKEAGSTDDLETISRQISDVHEKIEALVSDNRKMESSKSFICMCVSMH